MNSINARNIIRAWTRHLRHAWLVGDPASEQRSGKPAYARPQLESLEERALLAFNFADGVLTITGTANPDIADVKISDWGTPHTPYDDRVVAYLDDRDESTESMAVRLWDADKGKETQSWQGHKDEVRCLAVLSDGRSFVSGGKDALLCYYEFENKKVWPCPGLHLNSIEAAASSFAPARAAASSIASGKPSRRAAAGIARTWADS